MSPPNTHRTLCAPSSVFLSLFPPVQSLFVCTAAPPRFASLRYIASNNPPTRLDGGGPSERFCHLPCNLRIVICAEDPQTILRAQFSSLDFVVPVGLERFRSTVHSPRTCAAQCTVSPAHARTRTGELYTRSQPTLDNTENQAFPIPPGVCYGDFRISSQSARQRSSFFKKRSRCCTSPIGTKTYGQSSIICLENRICC